MNYKVLSVQNPWAYLIAYGVKDIENRGWSTPYRGKILIHASGEAGCWVNLKDLPKPFQDRANAALDEDIPYANLDRDLRRYSDLITWLCDFYGVQHTPPETFEQTMRTKTLSRGFAMDTHAIIGSATLADIVDDSPSPWAKPGKRHWILKDAELFDKPISGVRGKLGLWWFNRPTNRPEPGN